MRPVVPGGGNNGLRFAVVASLLLHLLLLGGGTPPVPVREAAPTLAATLRMPAPAPAPPAAVAPAPTIAPPVPKVQPPVPVLERPSPISLPPPAPIAASRALPAAAVATPAPEALPVPASPPPLAAAATSILTESMASGEAVDGLRSYRVALASQARRFKRYPAQAMAAGWTGTTDVRVEIAADGRPRPAQVVKTSTHDALDRAAVAMVDAGALRARVPDSLRGKAFAVVLPVVFDLAEE